MDYRPIAKQYAQQQGIPWAWFEKQITIESNWNPSAHNPSGANGIAQIVPSMHPGVNTNDPVASLAYAARYVRQLYDQTGGSWPKAFAAYNWGIGRVSQWNGSPSSLPAETRSYLDGIFGTRAVWTDMLGGGGPDPGPVDPVETPPSTTAWGSIGALVGSWVQAPADAVNEGQDWLKLRFWNIGAAFVGTGLIGTGLWAAAFRSPPAKAATETTARLAPDPRVSAYARGIRAVQ